MPVGAGDPYFPKGRFVVGRFGLQMQSVKFRISTDSEACVGEYEPAED